MTAPKTLDASYNPPRIFGPQYRVATLGILLSVTLVAFEGMSVGIAMPAVADDLNAYDLYGMSFSAFLIAGLFANVITGLWSDRRGYALPFLLGMGLFVVGMALAGAAMNKELFLAARALQGMGGGAMVVALYVMIAKVYPAEVRPKIFAALSAAWVLPAMIGPAVAGLVVQAFGWRWVFYGIVPLIIPALFMLLPALRVGSATGEEAETPTGERSRPVAMILAAVGTSAGAGVLLIGVDRLHVSVVTGVIVTLVGLVLLGVALPRLLPPGTLRFGQGLPTTIMMRSVFSAAFFGVSSFIPLVLTKSQGFTEVAAGIALTTGALGWSTGSYLQSRWHLAPEKMMRLGAVGVLVGVLGVLTVGLPGVSGWVAVPVWIIAGFGMGIGVTTVSVTMLKQSPPAEQGVNSAALQVMDTLGSALAIGLAGALINVIGHGPEQIATGFMMITGAVAVLIAAGAVLAGRARS